MRSFFFYFHDVAHACVNRTEKTTTSSSVINITKNKAHTCLNTRTAFVCKYASARIQYVRREAKIHPVILKIKGGCLGDKYRIIKNRQVSNMSTLLHD